MLFLKTFYSFCVCLVRKRGRYGKIIPRLAEGPVVESFGGGDEDDGDSHLLTSAGRVILIGSHYKRIKQSRG